METDILIYKKLVFVVGVVVMKDDSSLHKKALNS